MSSSHLLIPTRNIHRALMLCQGELQIQKVMAVNKQDKNVFLFGGSSEGRLTIKEANCVMC